MAGTTENDTVNGFNQHHGWFNRKCVMCGNKTTQRVSHRFILQVFSDRLRAYDWFKEPMHFNCHMTSCLHSFCRKWAPEFEKIQMERMRTQLGGSTNTITDKGEKV